MKAVFISQGVTPALIELEIINWPKKSFPSSSDVYVGNLLKLMLER